MYIISIIRTEPRHVSATALQKLPSWEDGGRELIVATRHLRQSRCSVLEEPPVAQSREGQPWVPSDPRGPPGAAVQLGFLSHLVPPLYQPPRASPAPLQEGSVGRPQYGWWRNQVRVPGEQGASTVSLEDELPGRAMWPRTRSGMD